MPDLLEQFLTHEADEAVRDLLLTAEPPARGGSRYFTFNTFNVLMDFEAARVTIEDVLDAASEQAVPMDKFLDRLRVRGHA